MKFNEKEMAVVGQKRTEVEGRLNYKCPPSGFRDSGYKDRWFRLKGNLLFYFRLTEVGSVEEEPAGVLVLENCTACHEIFLDVPYAFSIIFNDEGDKKHIFAGTNEDQVKKWIAAVQIASYSYWRTKLEQIQKQLTIKTGKDPMYRIPYNSGSARSLLTTSPISTPSRPHRKNKEHRSTMKNNNGSFQSHINFTDEELADFQKFSVSNGKSKSLNLLSSSSVSFNPGGSSVSQSGNLNSSKTRGGSGVPEAKLIDL